MTIDPQGVGPHYNKDHYKQAQMQGWKILHALKEKIRPGLNEKEGRDLYSQTLKEFGIEKNWHPPKIRFGPNSIKSFREISDEDYRLQENDIFFLDLGPIVNGYEADVGQTFTLGNWDTKIISDGEEIFRMTKQAFYQNQMQGPALYTYAEDLATKRGWSLVGEGANGHRVGDFPHHVFYKGNLRDFKQEIIPDLWILEIQLRSPDMKFGAFFEDVL